MDDSNKYLPVINLVLNILILPIVYWVIKIENKLTKIATILGVCKYCPKPSSINSNDRNKS